MVNRTAVRVEHSPLTVIDTGKGSLGLSGTEGRQAEGGGEKDDPILLHAHQQSPPRMIASTK
jgi:hypothetical protein